MEENEMYDNIYHFILEHNDYHPTKDSKKNPIIGYYNAFLHNKGVSLVYPKTKKKDVRTIIVGYEARKNGEIYLVTLLCKRYKLSECKYNSIESVYKTLMAGEI